MVFSHAAEARGAVSTFLRAEVLAARLEAMARAEPEVGNLWRSEIALANKMARGLWAMMTKQEDYRNPAAMMA